MVTSILAHEIFAMHICYMVYILTTLRSQQAITRSEGKDSTIRFSQRQGAPQTTSNYIAYN